MEKIKSAIKTEQNQTKQNKASKPPSQKNIFGL